MYVEHSIIKILGCSWVLKKKRTNNNQEKVEKEQ